ncbi:MAG: hypothetical protein V1848_00920, partial [Candidatus Magasanikbacteria bacterium]
MKKQSVKQSTLFYIIQKIVFISIISGVIIFPAVHRMNELKTYISSSHRELEDQFTRIKLLKKSLQELSSVQSTTENFKKASIQKGSELEIIKIFENLAQKHQIQQNLSVSSFETQKNPKAKPEISPYYYTFTFPNTGEYVNQMEYLEDIEHLPFYTIIDAVTINKKSLKNTTSTLSFFQFEALIYATE